jgi:heat shock protein HtpX
MTGVRTVFLLTLLTGILVGAAYLLGLGRQGMTWALFIGLGFHVFNYWFSSRLILASYGAHVLEPGTPEAAQFSWLLDDVREMTEKAGMPMPKVALIPNEAPNAFATGRNPANAVVAATVGLLRICDRREVRAVLGHELGHVRNRDMLTMTIVAGAVSAITFLPWIVHFGGSRDERGNGPGAGAMLLTMILAPLVATLVQFAISRNREYAADASGAGLSGDPAALANALEKLHRAIPRVAPLTQNGATAHLMIANPFTGHGMARLFSTHPDPEDRIRRLRDMAAGRLNAV